MSPLARFSLIMDVLIWIDYMVIGTCFWMVLRPAGTWGKLIFGGFVVFCGLTHASSAWATWHGVCEVASPMAGLIKGITAGFSTATAVFLGMMWARKA